LIWKEERIKRRFLLPGADKTNNLKMAGAVFNDPVLGRTKAFKYFTSRMGSNTSCCATTGHLTIAYSGAVTTTDG